MADGSNGTFRAKGLYAPNDLTRSLMALWDSAAGGDLPPPLSTGMADAPGHPFDALANAAASDDPDAAGAGGADPNFIYQPPPTDAPIEVTTLPPLQRGAVVAGTGDAVLPYPAPPSDDPIVAAPLPPLATVSAPAAASGPAITGYATFYNNVGRRTASGQMFDPGSSNAAMFRPGAVHLGDRVNVQLQGQPTQSVVATINDTGPFAVGPDGRVIHPLQPHPSNVIDLTPQLFEALAGNRKLGRVPVIVTPLDSGP